MPGARPFLSMKITPTTSLNEAIRRIAMGNIGAASVIGLILKEYPDRALAWLREMDRLSIYGQDVWMLYCKSGQGLADFLKDMNNGSHEKTMRDKARGRK